jgi:diaminohydroxyphosphoribosylaminopyrimidine deaminase / 5-amino-6-(5-phosphoribosylamino)uracil reductase
MNRVLEEPGPENDQRFMRRALMEARKGLGTASPNPSVGAVIVKNNEIISIGYHREAGGPHAEIEAMAALTDRRQTEGATLYVTLEPCSTQGRTPPCTEAIIRARFARVVVAAIDPNEKYQGRGLVRLRQAGIEVTSGILEKQSTRLNVGFNKWITTGLPWVIAKVAQSLDGRLTRPPGEPPLLSNEHSRRMVQRLRRTVDAILVGAETVRRDNPKLTLRPSRGRRQPWRVVVTRSGNLPEQATLFTDEFSQRTVVFRNRPWAEILRDLGSRGVTRLLVEGGGETLGGLLDEEQIDEVWCFFAPMLVGGDKPSFGARGFEKPDQAPRLYSIRYRRIGEDLLATGLLNKNCPASQESRSIDHLPSRCREREQPCK